MRRTLKWGIILAVSIAVWTAIVHLLGFYTDRIQYADLVDRLAVVLPVVVLIVGGLIGTVALGLVLSLIIALSLKFLDRFRQGGATRA